MGLVLITTAEPNFAQLRGVERAGVNWVVKESHFNGVVLGQK